MKRFLLSLASVVCAATISATNYTVFDIANAGEWGGNAEGWGQTVRFGDKSFKVTSVKAGSSTDLLAPNYYYPHAWRVYKSSGINIEATNVSIKQITINYDDYLENKYSLVMTLSEGWTDSLEEAVYTLTSAGLDKMNAVSTNGQVRIKQIIVSDQIGDTSEALLPTTQEAIYEDTPPDHPKPTVIEIDGTKYRINEDNPNTATIISIPQITGDTLVVPDRIEFEDNEFIVTGIDWGQNYQYPKDTILHAIIPKTIKHIGDYAFYDCHSLAALTIPDSVTTIGDYAFQGCYNLKSIDIPNSVVSIGAGVFMHTDLNKISIGKSVVSVGENAFPITPETVETYSYNISGIEESGLSQNSKIILKTDSDFSGIGSTNLTYFNQLLLKMDDKDYGLVTSPLNLDFTNCIFNERDKYVIPLAESNARISNNCQCILFRGENITDSVANEGGFTFVPSDFHKENIFSIYGNADNPSLTQIIHLDEAGTLFNKLDFRNIENIEALILSGDINGTDILTINRMSSLKYLDITNANIVEGGTSYRGNLKTADNVIGERFFNDIELEVVYLPSNVVEIDKEAFADMPLKLVTIPSSTTSIGNSAFLNCSDITLLSIPSSVQNVGDKAFSGCSGIKHLAIEDGNNELMLGSEPFSSCKFNSLYLGRNLSLNANSHTNSPFIEMQSLTSVTISDAVTSICNGAFGQTGLKSIVIPESVTAIGEYAFASCGNLETIELPHSLKSLGKGALFGCNELKFISIPAGIDIIEDHVFGCCFGLTTASMEGEIKSIGSGAFYRCRSLTSLQIPQSVKTIGAFAFMGCNSLSSFSIPEDIEIIENQVFKDCRNLTSFSFPDKVTSIGFGAFEGCVGLTSIQIPRSVLTIGDSAFKGCTSLSEANIPDSITSIGEYAFYNTALKEVLLPAAVKNVGDYAFGGNTGITKVISLNTVPPEIFTNTFDNEVEASIPLHVPRGSLMYYWLDPVWKEFKNMSDDVLCLQTIPDARYGDDEIDLSQYAPEGIALTYQSSNEDVVKINGSSMQIVGAGEATVAAILDEDGTTTELVGQLRNVVVDKADLTVSVEEIVIEEGSPIPDFSYLAEGLLYDDTLDDIDNLPQPIHEVDENSPVGEYAVTFTDGSDHNYRITTNPSKITVVTRTGVKDNLSEAAEQDIEVYDLEGLLVYRGPRRDAILQKGIYIVRQGKVARKISVK